MTSPGRTSCARAAGDGPLGLGGDALPELEGALVGALGDQGAAADPAQHRAAFEVLEVLADGDGGDAEPAAQLTDLDPAVLVEVDEDGLFAVELAQRCHPASFAPSALILSGSERKGA